MCPVIVSEGVDTRSRAPSRREEELGAPVDPDVEAEFDRLLAEHEAEPEAAGSQGDAEMEEGQAAKGRQVDPMPGPREVAEHWLAHQPYRSWCEDCVMGRSRRDG